MSRGAWGKGRAPVEVKHPPERYLRAALGHILTAPKPRTWGRIKVKGGALRWDVDADGFVWFVATGEWRAIEDALHRHARTWGWVDSGGLCFALMDNIG